MYWLFTNSLCCASRDGGINDESAHSATCAWVVKAATIKPRKRVYFLIAIRMFVFNDFYTGPALLSKYRPKVLIFK
jgi:hypothetical protein